MFKRLALAFAALLAQIAGQAFAQQPVTWNYSFDANGVAQATYPGNVLVAGEVTTANVINVAGAPYDCTGDGTTDDSACIKAAFAAANAGAGTTEIYFPPAPGGVAYRYCPSSSPTLEVTKPNITIRGSGWAGAIYPCQTSGDFIHASPAAGPNLQGFQVKDLAVYAVGANPTSGALLHLEDVNGFKITGSDFRAYYGGVHFDGAVSGTMTDTGVTSDANFTSLKTGSYLIKASKAASGQYTQEVFVGPGNYRGQNGNNYLDCAISITGVDGIWFTDPHVGFARRAMCLTPADDTTQLTSVIVHGGYIDTTELEGFYVARPSPTYAADFGAHDLDLSNIYNTGTDGIQWTMTTTGKQLWSNIMLGSVYKAGHNGANLGLAQAVIVKDGWAILDPGWTAPGTCAADGTCNGIVINNTSTNITIGTGVVERVDSAIVNCAMQSTTNVTNFRVAQLRYKNTSFGTCDTSVTANKQINTPLNW